VDLDSQEIGIAMGRDQQYGTDRIMNIHSTAIIMKHAIKCTTRLQQINQNNTCINFMWHYRQNREGGLTPFTFWQFTVNMHTFPIPDHGRTKRFPASNKPKLNSSKLFYYLFRSYSYVFSSHLTLCMSIYKDQCCLAEPKG